MGLLRRMTRSLRYRLGAHVVAADLEEGTDEGVRRYYNSRASDCSFLADPGHYERPRIDWMRDRVRGGTLLEIGCADGTVTAMLAPAVGHVVALDLCRESLDRLRARALPNVEVVEGLLERFSPSARFDWIIMSEVLEHLRDPSAAVARSLEWLAGGGRLLLSSPDGAWEGDAIEHLHVFDLRSWSQMLIGAGGRDVRVFRIKDGQGRDRWLGAEVVRD